MKRLTLTATFVATLLCLMNAPLFAQRRGLGVGAGLGAGVGAAAPGVRIGSGADAHAGANTGVHTGNVGVTTRENAGARAQVMERQAPSEVLTTNTHLSSRLQTMLPSGENVQQASAGFENTGQFVSAVHASNNLNIPFDQLKAKMTGSEKLSLGQSIQQLDAKADAKAEAKKATKQAREDLESSAMAQADAQAKAGSKTVVK